MPAGPRALPLHAAHHTTSSEAAPSTRHAPGWVLEAPQGEQPGHVSDVLPAFDDFDGANVVQHDSGHPSHSRSSMHNFVAHSSVTGDLSSYLHASTAFSTNSGMVLGWVPGAPAKGSSLSTTLLTPMPIGRLNLVGPRLLFLAR